MKAPADNVVRMYLVKHLYLLEIMKKLNDPKLNNPEKKKFDEIEFDEKEITNATIKELNQYEISGDHITPNMQSLIGENYIKLIPYDNYTRFNVRLTGKGLTAGTGGEFWQRMESRERDLLQKQLAASSIKMNTLIRRSTIANFVIALFTLFFIAASTYFEATDTTGKELHGLQQESQNMQQELRQLRTSLLEVGSSIQTLRIDTPISVRVVK